MPGGVGLASAQPPALAPIAGSPFPTGFAPQSLSFSPDGRLIATADIFANWPVEPGAGSMFSLSPPSTIAPLGPFDTGEFPQSLMFSPRSGLLAIVADNYTAVSMLHVAQGGSTALAGVTPVANAYWTAFSPDGDLLAVTQGARAR